VPGSALAGQQAGDVVKGAPQLCGEIANVNAVAVVVDRGGAGDKHNDETIQIDPHAARE